MILANTKCVIFFFYISLSDMLPLRYCGIVELQNSCSWWYVFMYPILLILAWKLKLYSFYLIFFSSLWVFRFLFTINREFVKSEKIVSNSYLHFSLSWYNEKPSSRLPFHGRFSQFSCVFFNFPHPIFVLNPDLFVR